VSVLNTLSAVFNIAIAALIATAVFNLSEARAQAEQRVATQIECLAKNIYYESRSENIEGQIGVGHVTMNRVNNSYWPDTICEVVYQKFQFSWTHLVKNQTPGNKKLYAAIYKLSEKLYNGEIGDNTDGSTFYYADYIAKPNWAKQMEKSVQLGVHIFYKWDGTWD